MVNRNLKASQSTAICCHIVPQQYCADKENSWSNHHHKPFLSLIIAHLFVIFFYIYFRFCLAVSGNRTIFNLFWITAWFV